ncbi:threonine ammonia-lyase [Halobacterium noricense]|uniref:threonine ammonia-lyase n=1 Tax=Halobacterium noricense TaxID=223182 RepID=UPI001E36B9D9|nr:threonine ammonia-lyase [Halobacterium noricense]UHH23996.1 threonine ammonia-lyase [Halobacterium noricense]
MAIELDDIQRAQGRLDSESVARETPVETSRTLDSDTDAQVFLKMEHLQRTGSFKTRGAYNKLTQVEDDDQRSIDRAIAASAGNHAQGVALAAAKTGLEATIVMPTNAPQSKVDATRGYGADVELHGKNFQTAMDYAQSLVDENTVFVHAYDDPDIVAGQGTLGLEVLDQVPDVDTIVVPVGGGGLIGGVATAVAELAPSVRVIGVQAEDAATVPQSLQKGAPQTIDSVQTIADGIATGGISELTYDLIDRYVDEVVTVSDTEIAHSIRYLLERTKQMVEGAGAATVAGLLNDQLDVTDETVVPVLSGGNLSATMLQRTLTHELTYRQQLVQLRVRIIDEPGKMGDISNIIADQNANIRTVNHERAVDELKVGEAYLDIRIETSGDRHTRQISRAIEDAGYEITRLN